MDAPAGIDRPRWRTTLTYRFTPTLQAGIEFNAAVGEANPIANWFVLRETAAQPALVLGTSSDRIGTPEGKRAWFATVARSLRGAPLSVYAGVSYSEADRTVLAPFGCTVQLAERWSLQPMHDGHATHTLLTWSNGRETVSVMAVWNRRVGVSLGLEF